MKILDLLEANNRRRNKMLYFRQTIDSILQKIEGKTIVVFALKDTTWLFGHTHTPVDVTLGDTRDVANPYGYNKNPNYTEMIIQL